MTTFKSLNTKKYIKSSAVITPDSLYWKKLSSPVLVKEFGAIDYIDFSPVEPYYFAVTCSVRVQIYNPITKLVAKNLSRFQDNAYGGTFRRDGKLLVAGDEGGTVRLFNSSTKNILRMFKGHVGPVHRAHFVTNYTHIVSFSDDKTVKLWDIPSEKLLYSYGEHQDYVRAGCLSPISPDIVLSGGYDRMIKMYDTRTDTVVFNVDHGSPVESLLFLPTGGIFLSGGGTDIKVWDAFGGGRLLAQMSQHHKTITCLHLASNGRRFMSGGLDRHVKVYDISTYKMVHNFDFPNAVLSLGVSPNDDTLVAGMVDGLISIQRMDSEEQEVIQPARRKITTKIRIPVDEVIEEYKQRTEAKYDKWLRKYEYSKALDEVLLPYVVNKKPHVTAAVMQELIKRKGLGRAMAGRTHKSIAAILRYLIRYIGDHRFTPILIDATNILLNVYEDTFNQFTGEIGKEFIYLAKKLKQEENLTLKFLEFQGALETILAGAGVADEPTDTVEHGRDLNELIPSVFAKENAAINVN